MNTEKQQAAKPFDKTEEEQCVCVCVGGCIQQYMYLSSVSVK